MSSRCILEIEVKPVAEALAELDTGLARLIEAALQQNTLSQSSLNDIVTGNAYQSLRMRDDVRKGFRQRDATLFAGIPIAGKRFIDMGCNLGEKTRLAALAGASYAEGIEYEEFFVRIGGLVSVYNRTFNAVTRQGDITQPNCITLDFDIGGCFSAFVYVERNLAEILGHLKQLFMLETHQLVDGWYGQYVRRIEPVMPFWTLHGFTDHGAGHAGSWRALMLFGRDAGTLMAAMRARKDALPTGHRDIRAVSRPDVALWGATDEEAAVLLRLREAIRSSTDRTLHTLSRLLGPAAAEFGASGSEFGRWWAQLLRGAISYAGFAEPGSVAASADGQQGAERFLAHLIKSSVPGPALAINPVPIAVFERLGIQPKGSRGPFEIRGLGPCLVASFDDGVELAADWLGGSEHLDILPVWTNANGHDEAAMHGLPADHFAKAVEAAVVMAPPSAPLPAP